MDENYLTSMNESIEQFGLRFRIKKNRHLASLRSARINELQVEHFLLASNVSNKANQLKVANTKCIAEKRVALQLVISKTHHGLTSYASNSKFVTDLLQLPIIGRVNSLSKVCGLFALLA